VHIFEFDYEQVLHEELQGTHIVVEFDENPSGHWDKHLELLRYIKDEL